MKREQTLIHALAPAFGLLCSCTPIEPLGYVSPFDGATIAEDSRLFLDLPSYDYPSDLPIPPELIVLVDLDEGGVVPGALTRLDESLIRFTPEQPLLDGHRYVWRVEQPLQAPRGPRFSVPAALIGEARFTVGGPARALDLGVAQLDNDFGGTSPVLCITFSRPQKFSELLDLDLSVDGESAFGEFFQVDPERLDFVDLNFGESAFGVDVACNFISDDDLFIRHTVHQVIGDEVINLSYDPEADLPALNERYRARHRAYGSQE